MILSHIHISLTGYGPSHASTDSKSLHIFANKHGDSFPLILQKYCRFWYLPSPWTKFHQIFTATVISPEEALASPRRLRRLCESCRVNPGTDTPPWSSRARNHGSYHPHVHHACTPLLILLPMHLCMFPLRVYISCMIALAVRPTPLIWRIILTNFFSRCAAWFCAYTLFNPTQIYKHSLVTRAFHMPNITIILSIDMIAYHVRMTTPLHINFFIFTYQNTHIWEKPILPPPSIDDIIPAPIQSPTPAPLQFSQPFGAHLLSTPFSDINQSITTPTTSSTWRKP